MNAASPQTTNQWVIGLHCEAQRPPSSDLLFKFRSTILDWLGHVGLTATHVACSGAGLNGSGKFVSTTSVAGSNLVNCENFNGAEALTFIACPVGARNPAYEWIFYSTLSWNSSGELVLCITCDDVAAPFEAEAFELLFEQVLCLCHWDCGYSFLDCRSNQPSFHVLGLDNGHLSEDEAIALQKWYETEPEQRKGRIRSVYRINMVNPAQALQPVGKEVLREFMRARGGFSEKNHLLVWRVAEDMLGVNRRLVSEAGASIA